MQTLWVLLLACSISTCQLEAGYPKILASLGYPVEPYVLVTLLSPEKSDLRDQTGLWTCLRVTFLIASWCGGGRVQLTASASLCNWDRLSQVTSGLKDWAQWLRAHTTMVDDPGPISGCSWPPLTPAARGLASSPAPMCTLPYSHIHFLKFLWFI